MNAPDFGVCPSCSSQILVELYPSAFNKDQTNDIGKKITLDDDASCFYHPEKKADLVCDTCGRMICSLCEVAFQNKNICPSCLEKGKIKGKIKDMENYRFRYDELALMVALLPLFIFPPASLITAFIALYIGIKYRNKPSGITGGTGIRFKIARVTASLIIFGWVLLFFVLWNQITTVFL